jgi:thiamine transport system substrate-binding protein
MKRLLVNMGLTLLLLCLVACGVTTTPAPVESQPVAAASEAETEIESADLAVITLMSHDSFSVSEEVIAEFETAHQAKVELLPSGDAGSALNQAILSKNNPLADVFFGIDNTFMSRTLEADIFEAYSSPLLTDIPDELELDSEHRLLPVDFGDVCLNYDKAWFAEQGLEPPDSLEDLVVPAYESLTVVENPATSSPGLAFLLATIGTFGEDGYQDYWQSMRENDVLVVDGWEEAYWGQFSAASDGNRPIVVSYASSPPAEVYFAEETPDEAPTAAVVANGTCFRQIEFIGILKGTQERELAEKLIDFMLSKPFQEDIPLQMFVFPANQTAQLPDVFVQYTSVPEKPAYVAPDEIEINRETWIEGWTETVLR